MVVRRSAQQQAGLSEVVYYPKYNAPECIKQLFLEIRYGYPPLTYRVYIQGGLFQG